MQEKLAVCLNWIVSRETITLFKRWNKK